MGKFYFFVLTLISICSALYASESNLLPTGTMAPTFSLPTPEGDRISLRTYCGDTLQKPHINSVRHLVILNFWATYCVPCQKEIPELMRFAEKHAGDSLKIFCINIDKEGASLVSPFIQEKGYTLPVLLDPYRKTAERYGVKALPALFVLDPFGIIRFASVGFDETVSLDEKLENIISDIRAGRTVNEKAVSNSESVSVESETAVSRVVWVTPKARWDAIVKVECGPPVSEVAASLEVSTEEIRTWFADLKNAAFSLWDSSEVQLKQE